MTVTDSSVCLASIDAAQPFSMRSALGPKRRGGPSILLHCEGDLTGAPGAARRGALDDGVRGKGRMNTWLMTGLA